jgi:hypothetical protein
MRDMGKEPQFISIYTTMGIPKEKTTGIPINNSAKKSTTDSMILNVKIPSYLAGQL